MKTTRSRIPPDTITCRSPQTFDLDKNMCIYGDFGKIRIRWVGNKGVGVMYKEMMIFTVQTGNFMGTRNPLLKNKRGRGEEEGYWHLTVYRIRGQHKLSTSNFTILKDLLG